MQTNREITAQPGSADLLSYSMRGKRHIRQGIPCQDAECSCLTPQGWAVMAVADGVSESPLSEVASRRAVKAICDYWSGLTTVFQEPADIECLMKTAFNYAAEQSRLAEKDHPAPMGYETTLQVCLLIPERYLFVMWCGDGGVYAQDSGGTVESLTQGQRTPDGAVVTLCADPKYWKCKAVEAKDLRTVLMVTDGVNDAILHSEESFPAMEHLMSLRERKNRFPSSVRRMMRKGSFQAIEDDITVALLAVQSGDAQKPEQVPDSNEKPGAEDKPGKASKKVFPVFKMIDGLQSLFKKPESNQKAGSEKKPIKKPGGKKNGSD